MAPVVSGFRSLFAGSDVREGKSSTPGRLRGHGT